MPAGIRNDGQDRAKPKAMAEVLDMFRQYKEALKAVGVNASSWQIFNTPGGGGMRVFGMPADENRFPADLGTRTEAYDILRTWVTALNLGRSASVATNVVQAAGTGKPEKATEKPEKTS